MAAASLLLATARPVLWLGCAGPTSSGCNLGPFDWFLHWPPACAAHVHVHERVRLRVRLRLRVHVHVYAHVCVRVRVRVHVYRLHWLPMCPLGIQTHT